jgi:hypothetical protein
MALDITGKLIQLLPLQKGTSSRGEWSKQEFILETIEQFPKKVRILSWGDKLKDIEDIQPNETITVSVNIESYEYNGRWYTDVKAWRIQRENANAASIAPISNVPPPTLDDPFLDSGNNDPTVDDLPF